MNEPTSLDDMGEQYITLVSLDKTTHDILQEYTMISELVSTMLDTDKNETTFNVSVDSKTLRRIIEFMAYYNKDPMKTIKRPLPTEDPAVLFGPWYAEFINTDIEDIIAITIAANYMAIKPLLELGCAKIASLIKGKNPEEIKEIMHMK